MNGVSLARLPVSAKVFCSLFFLGIGLGNAAAFVQAATAVGLSSTEIRSSARTRACSSALGSSGHPETVEKRAAAQKMTAKRYCFIGGRIPVTSLSWRLASASFIRRTISGDEMMPGLYHSSISRLQSTERSM